MTAARRISSAVLEEREQEFRADGHTPEVARALALGRVPAVVRLDDHTPAHARLTAAIIRAARAAAQPNQRDKRGKFRPAHGIRSRIPRQLAPRAIEAEYARKIIDQVEIVRRAFRPLLEALPALLAAARAARGDAEAWGVVARRLVADLPIAIENPAGSVRRWRDSDGTEGETTMALDYGFIEGAIGADGDEVDVYIGPDPDAAWVYVIHQQDKASGFAVYDEDKVILQASSADAARDLYLAHYDDPRFYGGMSVFSLADFKARLVEHLGGKLVHRMDAGLALARVLLERHDASDAEWVRGMVGRAWEEIGERMAPKMLENLARAVGKETSDFQRRQLARQTKAAFSVDVATRDASVPTMIEHFVTENVSLITSIADRYAGDIEKIVSRAFTTGARHEDVAEEIAARFGVHERHARLIARDQLGSLTGQVTASRHRELGVRRFIWETAKDERVRPEHAALDGQVFAYDNLPSEGLPGEAVGCRCGQTPVLSDILDDAADEEAQA